MDRRRRNIDNLSRVVLDLLIALQIVEDNSRVVSITPDWDDDVAGRRIVIEVKRASAESTRGRDAGGSKARP
jgi:Holliday junction resolvase RusA-like endonuclease